MHRIHAALGSVQGATDFGQHATADGAIGKQFVNAAGAEVSQQIARFVQHAGGVGQQDQFFCFQNAGQFAGHHIGIDVVAFVVFAKANGADDRNKGIVLEGFDHAGVNRFNVAHLAHVVFFVGIGVVHHLQFLGTNQTTVTACQAHSLAAGLIDQAHNVLLHFTGQDPFHHFHGFGVGHAHALNELTFFAQAVQGRFNLRTTTMHHHWVHAHQFQKHHIFGKVGLQSRVGHGVAAVFDDQGLAVKLADVGQSLRQNFCFVARRNVGQ